MNSDLPAMIHLIAFPTLVVQLCIAAALSGSAFGQPAKNTGKEPAKAQTTSQGTTRESDEALKKRLTPEEYAVTRENATERPFVSKYWKNHEDGIYVDVISGKPLFSSKDKFDTDCGWPGFAKPIDETEIKKLHDTSHGMDRTEVRSTAGDAHLGHVFNDGPKEMGGLRYCINSASLRFVPKDKMAEAGYGEWLKLFNAAPKKEGTETKEEGGASKK